MNDWIKAAAKEIDFQFVSEDSAVDEIASIIEQAHEQAIAAAVPVDVASLLDEAQAEVRRLRAALSETPKLREALTWAVRFIQCNSPNMCGNYPDFHNAWALAHEQPVANGPFQIAITRAELAESERDRLGRELKAVANAVQETALLDHVQLDPLSSDATVTLADVVRAAAAEIERGRRHFMDEFKRGTKLAESVAKTGELCERIMAERDRYRAALEMLAQIRHVSGSAQSTFRSHLRIIDAALEGANVADLATVEAIAAGRWRYCDGCQQHVAGETWRQVEQDEVCRQLCHRHGQEA